MVAKINNKLININFEGQNIVEDPNLTANKPTELKQKFWSLSAINSVVKKSKSQTDEILEQNNWVNQIPKTIESITPIISSISSPTSILSIINLPIEVLPLGQVIAITDDIPSITPQGKPIGTSMNLASFRNDSRFGNIDGRGLTVVIIDTGIDLNHPFFGPDSNNDGIADRIIYNYDFGDNDNDASDNGNYGSHGSNVSSIVGSSDSKYRGVAPGVNLIHLKVFKNSGYGSFEYIEKALQWVVNNIDAYNIVSVNMSISDNANHATSKGRYNMGDEIAYLAANNVAVVAAAGNSFYAFNSIQGVSYPAADPNAWAVGAVYSGGSGGQSYGDGAKAFSSGLDRITPFSQRHETMTTVFAPGASITGANAKGGTVTMNGTSQAAPHVAGAVALAQQLALSTLGRKLTLTELHDLIVSTGVTINDGDDENDNVINTSLDFKRLDMLALGEAIVNMAPSSLPIVSISTAMISHTEGDEGNVPYSFIVTLNHASSQPITLNYSVNDGTAIAGIDYIDHDGTLTFNPGETSKAITVLGKGDFEIENDETFTIKLENASNALINAQNNQGTGTLVNDDYPIITLSPTTLAIDEGDSGTIAYTFTVSLDRPSNSTVTVNYSTDDGSAIVGGNDYLDNDGVLTFNAGETSKTITVYVKGDTIVEDNETFLVKLSNPSSNAVLDGPKSQSTGIIANDDSARVAITPSELSFKESNSDTIGYTFTVSLDRPSNMIVTVNYSTDDNTATLADNDYVDNDGTLTFGVGETSKTITVWVNGDNYIELNESFTVNLNSVSHASINPSSSQSTGNIVNDDTTIVSITPAMLSLLEGNSGTTTYNFLVSLDRPSNQTVMVNYSTDDGTATVAGNDYLDNDGTLIFAPGETSKMIAVLVKGDTAIESNESFVVKLDSADRTVINADFRQSTGVIINDDRPIASISPTTVFFDESDSGQIAYTFTVNLDRPSSDIVTVNYSTNDSSATVANNDYVDNDGYLTFNTGETSKTITVYGKGDTAIEGNESFVVRLNSSNGANISSQYRQTTGMILNDDGAIASISPSTIRFKEGDSGTVAYNFTVNLDRPSDEIITVNYSTNDSTATLADNDYINNDGILTFNVGETSSSITVLVNSDTKIENHESFVVRLNSANNAFINSQYRQATGSITNDDGAIVSINQASLRLSEGNSGFVAYTFTVSLDQSSDRIITVNYSTNDSTATLADNDYVNNDGLLTFKAGVTSQTITVLVNGDNKIEAEEKFLLKLNNATNAAINASKGQSTGYITNDDGPIVSITAANLSMLEGNNSQVAYIFTVSLDRSSNGVVTVNYSTNDSTATLGNNDYVDNDGTLTFNAGEISKTLTVLVNGDLAVETDEQFTVRLNSATGGILNTQSQQSTGVIINDDLLNPSNLARGSITPTPSPNYDPVSSSDILAAAMQLIPFANLDPSSQIV